MTDFLQSLRTSSSRQERESQCAYSTLGCEASRFSRLERHRCNVVVSARYVNRRLVLRRNPTKVFRPPSPRQLSDDRWKRARSLSPSLNKTPAKPLPHSSEIEKELDKLVYRFRVRATQKKQMWCFLEMGLSLEQLTKALSRRAEILDHRPSTILKKCKFLIDYANMTNAQFIKFFLRFPRILEYNMKSTVQPRLDFLLSIGFQQSDLARILIYAPAVTELSVKYTLQPRIEFLKNTVGISSELLPKTLLRQPQLLTYSENSMNARIAFLQEWNMSASEITAVIVRHPQILHYSVQNMSKHIKYLLEFGIDRNNVHRVITRFPQILSLDLEGNVIPTLHYLCTKLGGTTKSVENNVTVVGLSLRKRIIPRHRFLSYMTSDTMPMPVPLAWFKCTDEHFASNIAKAPLEDFLAFKERLVID